MTDDAYTERGRIPAATSSAAGRLALKRATLVIGAGVIGAYGLGAVLTYSPEDPSLNTAADGPTHNLFGGPGVVLADLAITALGAAAPLMMAALLGAAVLRVMRHQLVARIDKRRVGAATLGILLLAAAATTIPTPEAWPLKTGFGGLLGDSIAGLFTGLASMPALPFPHILTGIVCAIGGLLATGWAFQLRAADVKTAAQVVRRTAVGRAPAPHNAPSATSRRRRAANRKRKRTANSNAPRTAGFQPANRRRRAPGNVTTSAVRACRLEAGGPRRRLSHVRRKKSSTASYPLRPRVRLARHRSALDRQSSASTQADPQTLHAMSRQLEGVLAEFGVEAK